MLSERLFQQVPHLCRRLFLYLVGGVGVGGEGEACTAVTQHTGHGLDIDSVLQGKGCKGVPLRYNYDKPEKPRRIKGFEVFSLVFHPFPNRKITLK